MKKYVITYRSLDDIAWNIDVYVPAYSGDPVLVRGVGNSACIITWDGETDDPFSTIFNSNAVISVYNQGQIDVEELQNAEDKDVLLEVYRAGNLFWAGYLIPDGIQGALEASPTTLQLNATDGLSLLEEMTYSHNNLPGLTSTPTRCPMNYLRQILFSTSNLGLPLPITWVNTLECTAFPGEDVFVGSVRWSARGEGFSSFQGDGQGKSCLYILEETLKSMQCRIFQCEGKWHIRRVPEIVTGEYTYKFINADLGVMSVGTVERDALRLIGSTGYRFVSEDAVITTRKGVKSCRVEYEANVRENVLPNGSQDLVSVALPIYWGITGDGSISSVGGIDGRSAYATEVSNVVSAGADEIFTTYSSTGSLDGNNGLPIDSYTLVKRVTFGFIFQPQNGFPYNSETGIINYDSDPFTIQIIYNVGAIQYFLDEFAIWRTDPIYIPIRVDGTKIDDIIRIDFNRNNSIILPKPAAPLEAGDTCDIKIYFRVADGQRYTLDFIYINIDNNNDVYESTYTVSKNTAVDERTLQISSSFGGYMLSNFMSSWDRSDEECYFKDGDFYTGTLTGLTANTIMRYLYKSSKIFNGTIDVQNELWSFDEIYEVQSLTGKKFLPLNASYNTEKAEISLVAMECRNDDVSLAEKHYGSNDEQLSN